MSTKGETLLWRELRNRLPGGLKVRRQVPIGPYVADFLCFEKRVVIEVDGPWHDPVKDARRDAWFRDQGFTTHRVSADDVLEELEGVMVGIGRALGLDW